MPTYIAILVEAKEKRGWRLTKFVLGSENNFEFRGYTEWLGDRYIDIQIMENMMKG